MKVKPVVLAIFATILLTGCGGPSTTRFLHPEFNFGYVERVAVIPMENLTGDQTAGAKVTRYFVAELLSTEAFDVVEPGEVAHALQSLSIGQTADLTSEQVVALGRTLNAQGLFLGSISEAATVRSGGSNVNSVTVSAWLVETDTGQTVWSATCTENNKSFWSSLFGTGNRSMAEVTRDCVKTCINTLVR